MKALVDDIIFIAFLVTIGWLSFNAVSTHGEVRMIDSIIIHSTATPVGMDVGVEDIRAWHVRDNGWHDIGYHWVIRRDGTIEEGRPEIAVGAHVAGYNHNSIGVALVGGVASNMLTAEFNYTYRQMAALMRLLGEIESRHSITSVTGHNDHSGMKVDPAFNVEAWYGG